MPRTIAAPPVPSSIALTPNPIPAALQSEANPHPKFYSLDDQKAEEYADRIMQHQYTFPVRYPSDTEIIRTAPEDKLRTTGWPMIQDPESGEVYLVAPHVVRRTDPQFFEMCVWIGFALAVSQNGQSFLWPYLANNCGDLTSETAVEEARDRWVRVIIDKSSGDYHLDPRTWNFPKPRWPRLKHDEVVDIVFGKAGTPEDREIRSIDHPVMKRIRGDIAT
jgi:hypothetical protein